MERPPKNQKEQKIPEEEYLDLIDAYRGRVKEMKKLERRFPGGVGDKEITASVITIDQERHEIHLKLIELGKKFGKGKDDVLVDIIRKDGTLDEYELPEFSILTENDIIDTGDWHNPYYFNVDPDARRPSTEAAPDYYKDEGERLIEPDKVMLVFAIVPIENYGGDELDPEDYEERVGRAHALAKKVGGEVFESRDSGYHEAYAKILGVIIPKKDLEKVAAVIRNNPDQYRLGDEFYPDKVKSDVELLQKVNSIMEAVVGEKTDFKKLPNRVEGAEVLQNEKIVMVDDDETVFKSFIPHLLVATEGKAIFIFHGGQNKDELAIEIFQSDADVVLLDYHLSMGIKGTEIARTLKELGFRGIILGFSSDKSADQAFKKAGALGAVNKNTGSPEVSIRMLAQILSKE